MARQITVLVDGRPVVVTLPEPPQAHTHPLSDLEQGGATEGQVPVWDADAGGPGVGGWVVGDQTGGGVTDHGQLDGLGDDDHTQYHTDARGDARYPPKARLISAGYGLSGGGDLSADRSFAAVLSHASGALASDVLISAANTFVTGPSVELAAGTWLVVCTLTVGRAATGATGYSGRITDGATHYASASASTPSLNPHVVCLSMSAVVALPATTTVKGQAASVTGGGTLYAAAPSNGSGNTASRIVALRLA